jgi:hypothetical protein
MPAVRRALHELKPSIAKLEVGKIMLVMVKAKKLRFFIFKISKIKWLAFAVACCVCFGCADCIHIDFQ